MWRLGKKQIGDAITDAVQADLRTVTPTVDRILVVASAEDVPFEQVHDLRILLYDATATGASNRSPTSTYGPRRAPRRR